MLPKFLLADNSQVLPDKIFVVHNEQPRFIVGCDVEGFSIDQEIYWIDDKPESEELVKELDYCFMKFDEIIDKYGIEKIKTIGDAYLCASGLPIKKRGHALRIVSAAKDFF